MNVDRRVIVFGLVTFAISWLFWIPDALIAQEIWNASPSVRDFLAGPFNLGPWGPLVAAVLVTFFYDGSAGVGSLLRRGLKVRIGGWWWVALLLFPVLIGGALLLGLALGDPMPELVALQQPIALPIAFLFIFFLGGPLQEEFGWRGFAFEHLRSKYSALTAAVAAGLLWGLWHLPLFFVPRAEFYYNRPVWGLVLTTALVGIIIAWIFVNTNGSVFAAMLAHTSFNWSNYVFPSLGSDRAALILFGLYGLVVAYILWRYPYRTFLRVRPNPAPRPA